ncbi:sirohydrochlorin cobaltochelatase [Fonticella tunisiensis]|uniref:Sirohydrochlorin cobaltochelatase n=1 Tax=Fonticella tunisiensis TaxID=1096341 RepID=A0A4V3ETL2_9CLOT|nr:sirohydrochlorin cobaltochelatase [Fonticella tunisiensis]TDT56467.1 sirohydrochlorin cobaltochelatase [Fonticella tunisiensis]
MQNKKGILVISSGTSNEDSIKSSIKTIENKIAISFPDYDIKSAFASHKIINKLKARSGMHICTPLEAIENMMKEGFEEVIVQLLYIIPGREYNRIIESLAPYKKHFKKLTFGKPVLCDEDDYGVALEGLKHQIPELKEHEAVVLMGHGTDHEAQKYYYNLQRHMENEGANVFLGTIRGYPQIGDIIKALKKKNINRVILMPFMITAGYHAIKDMASSKENSWKSILEGSGFTVDTYLNGLGSNPYYQDIFVKRVREAIEAGGLSWK